MKQHPNARKFAAKRDTEKPCAICGWSEHMAIHQPAISGPRVGEIVGHAYKPITKAAPEAASTKGEES